MRLPIVFACIAALTGACSTQAPLSIAERSQALVHVENNIQKDCVKNTDCTVQVTVWAPGTYFDPVARITVAECVAVVEASVLVIPQGSTSGDIVWMLKPQDSHDPNHYKFRSNGIDATFSKQRYWVDESSDLSNGRAVSATEFRWTIVNKQIRNLDACHNPGNGADINCEIAYFPRVVNTTPNPNAQCKGYDPTIINMGP